MVFDDTVANALLNQDCYLRPDGASSFSDYVYLHLIRQDSIVTVEYSLMLYQRGKTKYVKGPDKIIIQGHRFKFLKRSKWQTI